MSALPFACGWLVGAYLVALTGFWTDRSQALLILALLAGVAAGLAWRAPRARLAALVLTCALLGAARTSGAHEQLARDPLDGLAGPTHLVGVVATAPEVRGTRTSFIVDVQARLADEQWTHGSGRVWIQTFASSRVTYGDAVELQGVLAQPRGRPGFPLPELLKRQGVKYQLERPRVEVIEQRSGDPIWAALVEARIALSSAIKGYLPEPHASLLGGILVGTRSHMPESLRQALVATGTSHIVAVSGFNITILAGLVMAALTWLVGRRRAFIPALAAIGLYALLTGPQPSALRAALMGGAALVAVSLGRRADPLTSLLVVAAAMLAFDPLQATDLGFQLSFIATAGLVLLQPPLGRGLVFLPRWLAEPLSVTLAAQVATFPLLVAVFHSVSLVAPLANLLIAPLLPALMGLGTLLVLTSSLPAAASLVAWPCWAVLSLLLGVIGWLGDLPGALWFLGALPAWLVAFAYGVLLCLGLLQVTEFRQALGRITLPKPPAGASLALATVLGAGLLSYLALDARSGTALRVTLRALDGSVAALARTPSGRTVLVARAEDGHALADAVADHLSPWETRLGVVALQSTEELSRVESLLRRYPAEVVLTLPALASGPVVSQGGVHSVNGQTRIALDKDVWLEPIVGETEPLRASGWRISHGRVAISVLDTLEHLPPREMPRQLEVLALTQPPSRSTGANPTGRRATDLAFLPGEVDGATNGDISALVRLTEATHGDVAIESDGRSILVQAGRCAEPFSPSHCTLLIDGPP